MRATITKLPKSTVRIEAELPAADFEHYRSRAVAHLASERDIPGFRRGTAPEAVLARHVGDMAVLEEMAELALRELYPTLVAEHRLDAIGAPNVAITKIGKGAPLGFTIETAVVPEVKLPDWKKFAAAVPLEAATPATDDEIEELMKEFRERDELKELSDDELAAKLGNFPDGAALRAKLKENLGLEKGYRAIEKRRIALLERLAEGTTVELPDVLVESELDRMKGRLEHDLARAKLGYEDYLKRLGKTEEALRSEWRPVAEKNAKIELALARIGNDERIAPDEHTVSEETKHFLEHSPGVDEGAARAYIASLLTKDLVIARLAGDEK